MIESDMFKLATEIANKISKNCEDVETSQKLIHLLRELLEIKWSLSPKSSA
jgi:hypothetical protein